MELNYSVDQQRDYSHKELYQFLSGVNLPSFVKEAELEEATSFKTLKSAAFADPLNRLFPINTRDRVYVSNAYFVNKSAELAKVYGEGYVQKVASAINKAAEIFEISQDLQAYNKIAVDRLDADYEDNSIVFKIAQDNFDLFTIKTAADVTNEANRFAGSINNYPFEWRRDIATEFVKAAEKLGVDELPDLVLKYAGQYYPDIEWVKYELNRRMTKLSEENQQTYKELISDVENIGSLDEFFKLAETCYQVEKIAGLYENPRHKKTLGDVVDRFFTLHFDKVASMLDVVEIGGEKFAMEDIREVSPDIFEKAFGFELDPKSAEARDILPTIPKSDVYLFKELSGVQPI